MKSQRVVFTLVVLSLIVAASVMAYADCPHDTGTVQGCHRGCGGRVCGECRPAVTGNDTRAPIFSVRSFSDQCPSSLSDAQWWQSAKARGDHDGHRRHDASKWKHVHV